MNTLSEIITALAATLGPIWWELTAEEKLDLVYEVCVNREAYSDTTH
jgi:hypothetical protein